MKYIVFDIDGVLADCSHRLKYIQGEDKDYDKFYSKEELWKDKPIKAGINILDAMNKFEVMRDNPRLTEFYGEVIFITGRNEICRDTTSNWLYNNILERPNVSHNLYMRPENDYRPAHEVKESLIEKHIGFENILFAFDDDVMVSEMYNRHGVMCYRPNMTKRVL